MASNKEEEKLLTILSMNGRAPAKLIGKLANISPQSAYRKVKALENKFKIRYTAEIDIESLGYLKFIILIKFADELPQSDGIRKALESEANIQYGVILHGGDYDVLFYVLAESIEDMSYICSRLRRNTIFTDYAAEWYVSPFSEHYSFMPLRDKFVETLKNKIINIRDKHVQPSDIQKKKQILKREFVTLRELNNNGSASLLDVDKKYGLDTGRSQYVYYKLLKSGLLRRITISLQNLPIRYTVAIFVKVTNQRLYYDTRISLLKDMMSNATYLPVNKYTFAGDITTPFGALLFLPVFEEQDLEDTLRILNDAKGATIKSAIITNTLIGSLCYRTLDNVYSEQGYVLQRDYGIKFPAKTDYTDKKTYYGVKIYPSNWERYILEKEDNK